MFSPYVVKGEGCRLHRKLEKKRRNRLKSQAQTLSPLAPVLVQVPALSSVQLGFLHLQNSLPLRPLAYRSSLAYYLLALEHGTRSQLSLKVTFLLEATNRNNSRNFSKAIDA